MRLSKNQFQKLVFVLIVLLVLLSSQDLIILPKFFLDILILVYLCFTIFVINEGKIIIENSGFNKITFRWFIIPFIIIFVFSIIRHINLNMSNDYYVNSLTTCYRMIAYILLVVDAYGRFKDKTPIKLLYICIISYIPTIIKHFVEYGLINGILIFFTSDIDKKGIELEVHMLTYIFGFMCIYFFFLWMNGEKSVKKYCIMALFFMLIGVKRIAIVDTILIFLLIFILLKFFSIRKSYILTGIASWIFVLVPILYIWMIQSGLFEQIMNQYNISTMSRLKFWNYFSNRYTISPSFWGYGISFSRRVMQHEYMNILKKVVNIHNDVLGYYLGLGFCGSIAYWYVFFRGRYRVIGKVINKRAAIFSVVISIYYFVIFMVSNAGLNHFDHCIYFLMICCACNHQFVEEDSPV